MSAEVSAKQRAADAAVALIESNMVVGLGTGSTSELFINSLGAAVRDGRLRGIRGVPTSKKSDAQACRLGIPIISLAEAGQIDVDVDGADEIDPRLDLIKGLGGALLREKIIAQNSKRMIVIADETKMVPTLGTHCPLPIEVLPFEHETQQRFLKGLDCEPILRLTPEGKPFVTDNGNLIYDCRFQRIADAAKLEQTLAGRAGIVETGLFLGIAWLALVARADGVQRIERR